MTKSSGLIASLVLAVVVALTFPLILALIDFVKSREPSALGPIPVQPEPLQAFC